MKRSEMVNQIKDTLLTWDNEVEWVPDHYKLAEDILSSIEEKGMIPPYNSNYSIVTYRYEWEPENEEK